MDDPYPIPAEYPRGKYLLLFDPLDGSSNIDVNVSVGSIFSVLRCPEGVSEPTEQDFLQPGTQQVCAGYAIYGPSTMLVLTTGRGVNGFTLDREIGEFMLTHPEITIEPDTSEFAINASNSRHWEPAIKRYVNECLAGQAGPARPRFQHALDRLAGRRDAPDPDARRRFHVPARPQGPPPGPGDCGCCTKPIRSASSSSRRAGAPAPAIEPILEVQPQAAHQRIGFVFGARNEVERIERYHRDHNEFEFDAPLFGTRGLFKTPA